MKTALAWLARRLLDLLRQRIRGVERRGDGAIGENAQIREIEFGASLRMQRHRVALSDAQLAAIRKRFPAAARWYSSQV